MKPFPDVALNLVRRVGWQQAAIAQAFGLTQPWVSRTLNRIVEAKIQPARTNRLARREANRSTRSFIDSAIGPIRERA
jgi:predicted transcriptional regulator